MDKEYLGDGVYVEFDSNGIYLILSTVEGHKIFLEPPEYCALEKYVDKHWKNPEAWRAATTGPDGI